MNCLSKMKGDILKIDVPNDVVFLVFTLLFGTADVTKQSLLRQLFLFLKKLAQADLIYR